MLLGSRWSKKVVNCCNPCSRYSSSLRRVIQEHDHVILRSKVETQAPVYTKPLRHGGSTDTRWGKVQHDDIIGKQARDVIPTPKSTIVRAEMPTLEDHVLLTPRLVTPVYPNEANVIVSLLDIHVSPRGPTGEQESVPPLEILEAGTGHGALTLYLARAVHAANPPLPSGHPAPELFPSHADRLTASSDNGSAGERDTDVRAASELGSRWKAKRGAVVHTIEVVPAHAAQAEKTVQSFRHGLYLGNVDFHTGHVADWITEQQRTRFSGLENAAMDLSFLSHIILDLPGSHKHIELASSALLTDGKLLVFNPSITQLVDCVKVIKEKKLPLILDRVLELGPGLSGGKQWELKSVMPRAVMQARANTKHGISSEVESQSSSEDINMDGEISGVVSNAHSKPTNDGWEFICRPKFGGRVVVGGFVAVWRKMSKRMETFSLEEQND